MTVAFRISAACRHYSQSSLRGRKWVPEDLINKQPLKRTIIKGKTSDNKRESSPSPSEEEEPEDPQLPEIKRLEQSRPEDIWPSEFLRLISGQFNDSSFMDDDDDDDSCDHPGGLRDLRVPLKGLFKEDSF